MNNHPANNETVPVDFALFDQTALELDDTISHGGKSEATRHTSASTCSSTLQRKRRSVGPQRQDKVKQHTATSSSSTCREESHNTSHAALSASGGDLPPTVVSVTSPRLIPDWYAVLGDKQSGGRGRTTTATVLLRDVKEWYKEQKPLYRDQGRLADLMEDSLQRYFGAVAIAFPQEFPTDDAARRQTVLIYCSKEARQSGRVAVPDCFTYENTKTAKFGLATVPAAIQFFLESRDAPSLPAVVKKLRRDFDAMRALEARPPEDMLSHFEGLLSFCEMQLQASASQEMAQLLLARLNLIPTLREQWKFLQQHAKEANGGRSVCSHNTRTTTGSTRGGGALKRDTGSQSLGEDVDSHMNDNDGGGRGQASSLSNNNNAGRQSSNKRHNSAGSSISKLSHQQHPNNHNSYNSSNAFDMYRQPEADDPSEVSGWSWSAYPSVVSESAHSRSPHSHMMMPNNTHNSNNNMSSNYGHGRSHTAADEESLTDMDGWQAQPVHYASEEGGRGPPPLVGYDNEINCLSFHDSAASAVSSVTATTNMMRMEGESQTGGGPIDTASVGDESWNQRAFSDMRLAGSNHESTTSGSVVFMNNDTMISAITGDDGGDSLSMNSQRSSMGMSSSNSSRRSRSRAYRKGRRRESGKASAGPAPDADVYHVTTISVVDPHGDHGLYTGAISNTSGMPHNFGRFDFLKGGRWYEGNWVHGHWMGEGRLSNGDGSNYEGGFQNDLKHGQGTMRWYDGRVFDGIYDQGQMTWGKMSFTDGGTYFGYFSGGIQHGKGHMVFADHSKYEGEFVQGNFQGQGKMTWNDGGYYEGEWQAGMIHGEGKEIRANGSLRHEGIWTNGQPVR